MAGMFARQLETCSMIVNNPKPRAYAFWKAVQSVPEYTVAISDLKDYPAILALLETVQTRIGTQDLARVNKANLKYPIILHPDGHLADGYHRCTKALIKGKKYIQAKGLPRKNQTCDK